MKSSLRILPLLLLAALVAGCQATKKPAPQNPPLTQVEPPAENPANMETAPEPAPMPEPAPEPVPHREHSAGAPHLGSLHATYNAKAGTLTVVLSNKILFALGSTKLKPSAHAALDRIASAIRHEYPGHRVYVDGHTDASPIKSGRWANNHQLAFDRAFAVFNYLAAHGIRENDIVIRSYGPINPKRSADASRRVEVVVVVR